MQPNLNELFNWFEFMMKMWLLSESGEEWDARKEGIMRGI